MRASRDVEQALAGLVEEEAHLRTAKTDTERERGGEREREGERAREIEKKKKKLLLSQPLGHTARNHTTSKPTMEAWENNSRGKNKLKTKQKK